MNTVKNKRPLTSGKVLKEGGFRCGLSALPPDCLVKARRDICNLCFWGDSTYKLKLSGSMPFRIYEVNVIEKYFSALGINAWTGESLN